MKSSPRWLQSILENRGPPARLYAWNLDNIHEATDGTLATQVPTHKILERTLKDLDRRIFVMGIGNLGRLFATSLAKLDPHPPVTLVVHRQALLLDWLYRPGIEITRESTVETVGDFDIEWWTEEPPSFGPQREVTDGLGIRNLIVTTKASEALPQVDRLRGYLNSSSTVAFAQNGMSKLWPPIGPAYVTERYPSDSAPSHPNWLACVTTHGVTSKGTFKSIHASQADLAIGPVLLNASTADRSRYLSATIARAPHLSGREVSRKDLWVLQLEKLVVNSIINPITAILRCKNGVLFAEADGVINRVMDLLLDEASNVLCALIKHESSSEMLSDAAADAAKTWAAGSSEESNASRGLLLERFSTAQLREMLYRVGHMVRENTSSMLQDVLAGKSTEIMDFNGWLVDTAVWLDEGLDVSGHQTLIKLVESGELLEADSLGRCFPRLQAGT